MRHAIFGLCCAAALSVAAPAVAGDSIYMFATGQKSGPIKGNVSGKGLEGSIRVSGVSQSIVSPRDPATGIVTGKRTHKPVVVRKELDRSSPVFLRALATNEVLPSVTLHFYGKSGSARVGEAHYYTIKLTNVSVASIESRTAPGSEVQEEEISLVYQKIEVTWVEGGITGSDERQGPV